MTHSKATELIMKRHSNSKLLGLLTKWNPKLTLEENGKKLGVNYARASQIANSYGLSWTKHYKGGYEAVVTAKSFQANIRMQMKSMRDVGVTLDKISKIYGITRERVRQILI